MMIPPVKYFFVLNFIFIRDGTAKIQAYLTSVDFLAHVN